MLVSSVLVDVFAGLEVHLTPPVLGSITIMWIIERRAALPSPDERKITRMARWCLIGALPVLLYLFLHFAVRMIRTHR